MAYIYNGIVCKLFLLSDELQLCFVDDQIDTVNDLYDIYQLPNVFKYYSDKPSICNKRMLKLYLQNQMNACIRGDILVWNIVRNKKSIGQVQLFDFANCYTCAQISFFLHPQYWNQGINTTVVMVISEYGFNKLELKRIEAYVYYDNMASFKSLEKAGFLREGILRNKYQIDGRIDNCYIYSKIPTN